MYPGTLVEIMIPGSSVLQSQRPSWVGVPETVMRYDEYLWRRPDYQKTQ